MFVLPGGHEFAVAVVLRDIKQGMAGVCSGCYCCLVFKAASDDDDIFAT